MSQVTHIMEDIGSLIFIKGIMEKLIISDLKIIKVSFCVNGLNIIKWLYNFG